MKASDKLKAKSRGGSHGAIWQAYSDMALLMLGAFMFLLVTILITSRFRDEVQVPKLKQEIKELRAQLERSETDRDRLRHDLGVMADMNVESQVDRILAAAGLDQGKGRKDFDLFVLGLKNLPGRTLHIVVDASGSMHGVSTFLVPILRVIAIRSGKEVNAVTWFADGRAETYKGSLGEMLDQLINGAPFVGNQETVGDAFYRAARNAPAPGAYLLIGDEPSDDRIYYGDIPAPVFTIPLGHNNPTATWEYQRLADKTGGRMLQVRFQ